MKIIVPLAGPDYFATGKPKGLFQTPDGPLLLATLKKRCWFDDVPANNYSFILLDSPESRAFHHDYLSSWFPGSATTFISKPARGAALSAAIGSAAILDNPEEPIIVDLADIQFASTLVPFRDETSSDTAAIGYCFESDLACYSYFQVSEGGLSVIRAEEKKVISNLASAGVYAFRSATVLLRSIAYVLEQGDRYVCNGIYYVCPLFNGVIGSGYKATISPVTQVRDIKTL
jgi:hypothetical protein